MNPKAFSLAIILFSGSAIADIYKCVGSDGRITYSNVQSKGCQKLKTESASTGSRPGSNYQYAPRTGSTPPPSFPPSSSGGSPSYVDKNVQKARDEERKRVLKSELDQESKALEQAKQNLSEGEETRLGGERNYQRYLDRVNSLKDDVSRHEQNIQSLQRELDAIK